MRAPPVRLIWCCSICYSPMSHWCTPTDEPSSGSVLEKQDSARCWHGETLAWSDVWFVYLFSYLGEGSNLRRYRLCAKGKLTVSTHSIMICRKLLNSFSCFLCCYISICYKWWRKALIIHSSGIMKFCHHLAFSKQTQNKTCCHDDEQVILTTCVRVSVNSLPPQTLWCLSLSDAISVN